MAALAAAVKALQPEQGVRRPSDDGVCDCEPQSRHGGVELRAGQQPQAGQETAVRKAGLAHGHAAVAQDGVDAGASSVTPGRQGAQHGAHRSSALIQAGQHGGRADGVHELQLV